MELNICHLYPDLLNLYGDIGNVLILKYRAKKRGIKVNISSVTLGDNFKSSLYDIVFFGGGQDFEQAIVAKDLLENKKYELEKYIEDEKVFLSICGGYQLLGNYYTTSEEKIIRGLSILDIYTEGGKDRFVGNTIIYNEEFKEIYVGFENHSGKTYIGNLKPLGTVIKGNGNNGTDGFEGCIYKNTFCSYFHGSLLSKNPELADRLITIALQKKYGKFKLYPLNNEIEIRAKEFIINREINHMAL